MFARIVRFTGVTAESVSQLKDRIKANDGPPPGVDSPGMKVFFDEEQGTLVFVGYFKTREAMDEGHRVLDAMDPGDTPGTRESVDLCEVAIEESS